jgi:DNA-binding response OmpR family regulator
MKSIMIIEDDPTMIDLLCTLLEMEGFQPIKVQQFDSVLAEIKQHLPDVVVMDVHLHEQNGLKILEALRADRTLKPVRVIMSSGMDWQRESMQIGADDFIMKPFMPEELIEKIAGLVG